MPKNKQKNCEGIDLLKFVLIFRHLFALKLK